MTYNPKHYPSLATCKALKEAGVGVDENGKILTKACLLGGIIASSELFNESSCGMEPYDLEEENKPYPCPDLHELLEMADAFNWDGHITEQSICNLDSPPLRSTSNVFDQIAKSLIEEYAHAEVNTRLIAHNTLL